MHPIYDSGGSVHAWLDEDVVRNLGGSVVALVMDGDRMLTPAVETLDGSKTAG